MFDLFKQLWLFIFKSNVEEGIQALAVRLRWHQRVLLAIFVCIALLFWLTNGRAFDPIWYAGQLIVAPFEKRSLPRETEYRLHVASLIRKTEPLIAERASTWVREAQKSESGFTWGVAQLIAASPDASAEKFSAFEDFLRDQYDRKCGCFLYDGVPHTITLTSVVLAYAEHDALAPPEYIRSLVAAQANAGWWSATLDAEDIQSNASIHATVWAILSLQEYLENLEEESTQRIELEGSVSRAVAWLRLTLPQAGEGWRDYPSNERSVSDPLFAGMVALAAARTGDTDLVRATNQSGPNAQVMSPLLTISSDAFVERANGSAYIDRYRHLPFVWRLMPFIVGYAEADPFTKVDTQNAMDNFLATTMDDQSVIRQEWIMAEFVVANSIALNRTKPERQSR